MQSYTAIFSENQQKLQCYVNNLPFCIIRKIVIISFCIVPLISSSA